MKLSPNFKKRFKGKLKRMDKAGFIGSITRDDVPIIKSPKLSVCLFSHLFLMYLVSSSCKLPKGTNLTVNLIPK